MRINLYNVRHPRMRTLTLHRGLAVARGDAKRVIETIRTRGLAGTEGMWRLPLPDIVEMRTRLAALFAKPDLTRDDIFIRTPFDGICACGVPSDAAYYALQHNFSAETNDHPIVIDFTAPIDEVYVDPRDFLCTAFQLWDRESQAHQERQSMMLQDLFGTAILRYFAAVCRSKNQTYRIAMCNLAALDPEVVEGHMVNRKMIGGRYNTRFSSAFIVKAPVDSNRISRVYTPGNDEDLAIEVSLRGFLKGESA